jgi:hypothetical protein
MHDALWLHFKRMILHNYNQTYLRLFLTGITWDHYFDKCRTNEVKYPVHRMYIVKLSKQCHLELEI